MSLFSHSQSHDHLHINFYQYQSLLLLCGKGDLHYDEKQWNISSIDD